MDLHRFEELLQLWQDGDAGPEELREFEALLRSDPALRRELVGSVLLEVNLYSRYSVSKGRIAAQPPKRRRWEAAAAVLVLALSVFLVGRLLLMKPAVGGVDVVALAPKAGELFEVRGLIPARIELQGGSHALLGPGSRGRLGTERFELLKGDGSFSLAPGAGPLRLVTPAGEVRASDSEFWVLLRPFDRKGPEQELVVEVSRGGVTFNGNGGLTITSLSAGQRRVFGPAPAKDNYGGLLDGATLSLAEAIDLALAAAPGGAVQAELENEGGKTVFSVVVAQDGRIREVEIDAKTGKVLGIEDDDEEDRSRFSEALKIPLKTAIARALQAAPGRAVEAETEFKAGRVRIEVKIVGAGGIREVKVDGETGEILRK